MVNVLSGGGGLDARGVAAARAGEAGNGFAVIAREIRSLSDRATELVSSARAHFQ